MDLTLVLDVSGEVTGLALPAVLVAGLFLFGWDPEWSGEAFGFDRRTFWLVVGGGLLGWVANIPIFAYRGSVMALNIGGGLIPLAVALVLLGRRILPGGGRGLASLLLSLGAATAGAFALVAYLPAGEVVPALLALYLAVGCALAVLPAPGPHGKGPLLSAYALSALGIVGTFTITQPVVNLGIVASFPAYLLWPVVLGLLSVPLSRFDASAPALAYATATLGVLTGADILHQAPLYSSLPFLGAIGGAGPLDLVYLSGPIALLVSYAALRASRGAPGPVPIPSPAPPPSGMDAALVAYRQGDYTEVPHRVLLALRGDAERIWRALHGNAEGGGAQALESLPAHPLVRADVANLVALERSPPRDATRARDALWTGYLLRRSLEEHLTRRVASTRARILAFLVDTGIFLLVAVPLLWGVFRTLSLGSFSAAVDSIPYEGALAALGSWPFVYFVAFEAWKGATPGKLLLRLTVVDASGRTPGILPVISRNVPKLIPLAGLEVALGLGLPAGYYAAGAGVLLAIVLGGLALIGLSALIGLGVLVGNPRRQRLGDQMAGTMVWWKAPPFSPGGAGLRSGPPGSA